MIVIFSSKTGNVKRFSKKLNLPIPIIDMDEVTEKVEDDFIFITYTTGFGELPEKVTEFLKINHDRLKGVASSGNKNWGYTYAKSADIISQKYKVPILLKFELSGTKKEIKLFEEGVLNLL